MKFAVLLAASTLLPSAGLAAPARDWTQAVTSTATGWRVGNPAAPRKLVEYASLNCPHCAHFAEFGSKPIMAAVKAGRLSFEYRPYLIFPHDVAATLIARCVPAGRRFGFIDAYYANTAAFTGKLQAADNAALAKAREQGMGAFNRMVVRTAGMAPLAARFGLTAAAADRCVADPAGLAWLQSAYSAAKGDGVSGTPTFRLNGQPVTIDSAAELSALLK